MRQHNQEQDMWLYAVDTRWCYKSWELHSLWEPHSAACQAAILSLLATLHLILEAQLPLSVEGQGFAVPCQALAFLESLAESRHPLTSVAPGIQHNQPLPGAPAALGRQPGVYSKSPALACPATGVITDRLMPGQIPAGG